MRVIAHYEVTKDIDVPDDLFIFTEEGTTVKDSHKLRDFLEHSFFEEPFQDNDELNCYAITFPQSNY